MIDLHVHTTYSDGSFTPGDVVRYAKEKELVAIAITDHDCVSGVNEAQETGNKLGIDVIPGMEISTNHETRHFHIIGLMIDIQNALLSDTIARQTEAIEKSTERLFDRLIACGFKNISFDEFRTQGTPSSKGHFKRYFKSANLPSRPEELEKYIGNDGMAYVIFPLKELLTVAGAIDVIHNAGGIAVWAHPFAHKLNRIELEQTVKVFKTMSLDAVEAYYRGLTQDDFRYIVDLANKYQLLVSGGSDFHGDTSQADLGTSYQNERIPYSVLSALKSINSK
jgi:3',5'-nucleoside bisphosphate phosphatase